MLRHVMTLPERMSPAKTGSVFPQDARENRDGRSRIGGQKLQIDAGIGKGGRFVQVLPS